MATLQALARVLSSTEYLAAESAAPLKALHKRHTVTDYYALPDEDRMELIDGRFYAMAAPSLFHQALIPFLSAIFLQHILSEGGSCRVLSSPCDVQLDRDEYTMVQPDLMIVCHPSILENKKTVFGAPDLVIEILSPSTRQNDLLLKTEKYRKAGVKEYWIIDPENERVIVYRFDDDKILYTYTFKEKIPVGIWNERFAVDFSFIMEHLGSLL